MTGEPGSIKASAQCENCGHFASIHHGGGGGRPGGSSCAAPDCECRKFVERDGARVQPGQGNLTPTEVAQLIEVSVHTLSYWRQSNQGPKPLKAGRRTLYRRADVEDWLAEVDGRRLPTSVSPLDWYQRAIDAAEQIDPRHIEPWKLANTYALLAIAETVVTDRTRTVAVPTPTVLPSALEQPQGELLTIDEVSAMTRVSPGTLRYCRHTGSGGPRSFKIGRRVLYRRRDIDNWLRDAGAK